MNSSLMEKNFKKAIEALNDDEGPKAESNAEPFAGAVT